MNTIMNLWKNILNIFGSKPDNEFDNVSEATVVNVDDPIYDRLNEILQEVTRQYNKLISDTKKYNPGVMGAFSIDCHIIQNHDDYRRDTIHGDIHDYYSVLSNSDLIHQFSDYYKSSIHRLENHSYSCYDDGSQHLAINIVYNNILLTSIDIKAMRLDGMNVIDVTCVNKDGIYENLEYGNLSKKIYRINQFCIIKSELHGIVSYIDILYKKYVGVNGAVFTIDYVIRHTIQMRGFIDAGFQIERHDKLNIENVYVNTGEITYNICLDSSMNTDEIRSNITTITEYIERLHKSEEAFLKENLRGVMSVTYMNTDIICMLYVSNKHDFIYNDDRIEYTNIFTGLRCTIITKGVVKSTIYDDMTSKYKTLLPNSHIKLFNNVLPKLES